ncbi:MAG TPA: SMI1/KNR4 family protein [Sphingomonas sp.]|nr:SMI1/KNR4 family protein [Sphingomonas sp.]
MPIALVAAVLGFAVVGVDPAGLIVASLGAIVIYALVVRFVAISTPPVAFRSQSCFVWPETGAIHDILRDWWRGHDGPAGEPIAEGAVAAFEERHGLTLPADFRAYLLHAAPVTEEMDAECTTWWPFERLRTLPEECPGDAPAPILRGRDAQCVVFADHLVWCWAWAICCGDDGNYGKVLLVCGDDRFVADSFTDFVRRHVTDWSSLC